MAVPIGREVAGGCARGHTGPVVDEREDAGQRGDVQDPGVGSGQDQLRLGRVRVGRDVLRRDQAIVALRLEGVGDRGGGRQVLGRQHARGDVVGSARKNRVAAGKAGRGELDPVAIAEQAPHTTAGIDAVLDAHVAIVASRWGVGRQTAPPTADRTGTAAAEERTGSV